MTIIIIAPEGDLHINIIEKDTTDTPHTFDTEIKTFKVSRSILINSSSYFKKLLSGKFAEATQDVITLHEDTLESMEVWMKGLHGILALDDKLDLEIGEVWDIIEAGTKYQLKQDILKDWFAKWFQGRREIYAKADGIRVKKPMLEGLAFLCWTFQNASAFGWVTKELVYETRGAINMEGDHQHSVPERVLRQMYAVRATMANKIDSVIFQPIYEFPKRNCKCKAEASLAYSAALLKVDAFKHIRDHYVGNAGYIIDQDRNRRSVAEQLEALEKFKYEAPVDACDFCKYPYREEYPEWNAPKVLPNTPGYFEGICLKCWADSIKAEQEEDFAYWTRDFPGHHAFGCGWGHGQPSWYFSYGGKLDSRLECMLAYKERKAGRMEEAKKEKKEMIRKHRETRKEFRKQAKLAKAVAAIKVKEKVAEEVKSKTHRRRNSF